MRRASLMLAVVAACTPSPRAGGPRPVGPRAGDPAHVPGAGADFLAVWDDDRHAADRLQQAVYATRVRADGTIVDPAGLAIDTRPQSFPPRANAVAIASGWLVTWERQEADPAATRSWDVWARRVDRRGTPGPLLQVSSTSHTNTDVAVAAAGDDALVAWSHITPTGGRSVMAAMIAGDVVVPVPLAANAGARPAVAFDATSGNFLLVWRDQTAIAGVLIDHHGTISALSPLAIPATRPMWDLGPGVATTGTGEFVVTWVAAGDKGLHAVRVDAARATLGTPAAIAVAGTPIFRHALAGAGGGYVLTWVETLRGSRELHARWLDGTDPLASPRPLDVHASPGIAGAPAIQVGGNGFLVTWRERAEPRASRVDLRGNVLDARPLELRSAQPAPVPGADLQADLDVAAANGVDYCGPGHDRTVPGTVTGILVEQGDHPWGRLYAAGFGWGTGNPGYWFHVGRDQPFAPHFRARPGVAHPFSLQVTIPDANRHRTERFDVELASGPPAAAAGLTGVVNLVELEANGGLGGTGTHFVITRARVVEDDKTLAARLTAARRRFDARVAASKQTVDRLLDAEHRKLKQTLQHPILSELPRTELVIYEPTWRPTTSRLEVLFGYQKGGGYMIDVPPEPQRGNTKHEPDPGGPRPARDAVTLGARYVLDGDRILSEEVWAPKPGLMQQAPWECAAATPPP